MLIWLWIRMKRRRAEKVAMAQQAGAAAAGQPHVAGALRTEPVAGPAARGQRCRSLTPGGGCFPVFLVPVSAGSRTKDEVAL